ncbi:MAG: DPP IV N-terminal domain-containing protein, partial [Acidobacteria bacterium]|nr:DPP IV N-terminal domain-containing protein [Acidobacteriota bacterium]
MRTMLLLAAALPLTSSLAAATSPPHRQEITVDWIFSDEGEALGTPSDALWTSDGTILLRDGSRAKGERTFERVDPTSLRRTTVVDARAALASLAGEVADDALPEELEWPESTDRAGRLGAYVFAGDLYLLRLDVSRFDRLTRTEAEESLPRLSPDGATLAFVRGNDLWLRALASGEETRVTQDGSDTVLNGTLSWVYWEEIFSRAEGGIRWAPDSSAVAFLRSDDSPVAVSTFVDIVPETPRLIEQRYPTAGTANPIVELGVYDLAAGRTSWLDRSTVPYEYLVQIEWLEDAGALGVVTLNRAQDRADLYRVERSGAARRVLTETDPAWVNLIDFHFLSDGSGLVASSQSTGHNHLYRYSLDGARLAA